MEWVIELCLSFCDVVVSIHNDYFGAFVGRFDDYVWVFIELG